MKRIQFELLILAGCLLVAPSVARAQTLSPPIAEYRNKADGLLTLSNDGDRPLAAILEVRGFTVSSDGTLRYGPIDPQINIQFGANSFLIPPHQSHYVFYKAECARLPCWFAILNTLTQATPASGGLRINIILPHLVHIYQRAKLKKGDVHIEALRGEQAGEYRLRFQNLSNKLERIESVQAKGFQANETYGGFMLFPEQTRWLVVKAGAPGKKAEFRIRFGGGLRLTVSPPEETVAQVPGS